MCATCLKSEGAPILDLSILPPPDLLLPLPLPMSLLPRFFFEEVEEPFANFCRLLIFLNSSDASPSSANANPIMCSCKGGGDGRERERVWQIEQQ